MLGQFSPATFTDYKFGNGYSPEPSSLAAVVDVDIDIRPFSQSNKIAHANWGLIPVAILSSENFDAPSKVDRDSITFGQTGEEHSKAFLLRRGKDVNHDGMKDLIIFFRTKKAGFEFGKYSGPFEGQYSRWRCDRGPRLSKDCEEKKVGFLAIT